MFQSGISGAGTVGQRVTPLPVMPAAHIREPLGELGALLPIQLPATVPGRAADDGSSTGFLPSTWDIRMEFLAPASSLAQAWLL